MPLDFSSTAAIRNDLLRRNLSRPYGIATELPINFDGSGYQVASLSNYSVKESVKIADTALDNLANNEINNAYNQLLPYVYPTLPDISIVLNRRGIYPLFVYHYKYGEFIGREPDMQSSFENSGDVTGGFTWRSNKIKQVVDPKDRSTFENSISTNFDYRDDSILARTQQILNSTPRGATGKNHVGNAIDQTSRIFGDGKKLISKGSAIKYVDKFHGTESGAEYARVWTKDRPYTQFGDTRKKKGNIRKFTESILDSPFNLNIAPQNGSVNYDGSTNIQKSGDGFYAKKYMFSIENLAWKASNRYGFRYEDLPYCERGPNGGRVMWFPPYGLQVTDSSSAKWNDNAFLGRVEPVYTYQGAERSGTLSFKIVVDHPSVLNLLVRKKFQGMGHEEVNNYVAALFAGAEDVDLYDLVRKYATLDKDDIERILAYLNGNKPTTDVYKTYRTIIPPPTTTTIIQNGTLTDSTFRPTIFFNDESSVIFTTSDEDAYTAAFNTGADAAGLSQAERTQMFADVDAAFQQADLNNQTLDKMINDVATNLKDGNRAFINIDAGTSSNETTTLSKGRIEALKTYILNKLGIPYEAKDTFSVKYRDGDTERTTELIFKTLELPSNHHSFVGEDCSSTSFMEKARNNTQLFDWIPNNFYCRIAKVYASFTLRNLISTPPPADTTPQTVEEPFTVERPAVPSMDEVKRILMKMLSEGYYFDAVKEETPHVYASLKEKLKYFHPGFHSTTPEGLNSRLTFLKQCTRPGDTIPIVQVDGEKTVSDARNTAFGPAPICVLRIGDFYHSKVIIRDVNVNYEDNVWDMNPEGIGFQPMIATVNVSLTFIGGQGLKEPVAELQNALSSNFFANTEMYDYRATATEDREKFNKEFLQKLVDSSGAIKKSDIRYPQQNSYGDPIGKFTSKDVNSSGVTYGVLDYTALVNDTITALNDYGKTSSEYFNSLYKKWGKTVASMILAEANRKYYSGTFVGTTLNLLGNQTGMGTQPDDLVSAISLDIRDMNFGVFADIKKQLTTAQYATFKANYEDSFKLNFETELAATIRTDLNNGEDSLYKVQKRLVNLIDKVNTVNNKIDGTFTKEKIREFTLSGNTNLLASYFTPYLASFNTLYSNMQGKLTNQAVASISEDATWRVNILTTVFTDTVVNNFMALMEGLGSSKQKKIKEMLKKYLTPKEEKVTAPKTIVEVNKSIAFAFTEDPATPNATTITNVFSSSMSGDGTTYNFSNLI